jgi:hypothetical protein
MYRCRAAYLFALTLAVLILCGRPAQPNPVRAQSAQAAGNQSLNNQTASLEGTVVNAQTGEPVRKAEVTVYWQSDVSMGGREPIVVTTDASGRFSIGGLAPGTYNLRAGANRFVPQGYGERRPGSFGKQITLGSGQSMDGLTLRLQASGAITGTVRDEDRDPVQGAEVHAVNIDRNFGLQSNQERTNDLGEYRLYNLMPGRYLVHVSRPDGGRRSADPQQAYVPLFYPGVTAFEEAIPVSVQPGNEAQGIDFDLKPVHAVRLSGRVANLPSNQQATTTYVMLLPRNIDARTRKGGIRFMSAIQKGTSVRDSEGDFEIEGVPAGSYWLYGGFQEKDRRYDGRVPLEVGDTDVQGIDLVVTSGTALTGHVRVEPPQSFDFSKLGITVSPVDSFMGGAGAQARSDGSFVLQDVASGNYRLNVSGFPEQYYVKSARLGGADVLENGFTLDSGRVGALDIVLSSSGGSISGAVLKDHQPAQATVFLVPDAPRRDRQDLYSSKLTKLDGTFTMLGLPPGDFKLFAFEDPDPDLQSDPSLLQPYETKGQSVHIADGQSQSVQLELIPAED